MLNNVLMPAEKGVFYSYSANFSSETPLYLLQKCKANKNARPTCGNTDETLRELDLVFIFGDTVSICSPNHDHSVKLLGAHIDNLKGLNTSEIRISSMSSDKFRECSKKKDSSQLEDAFNNSSASDSPISLSTNMILSVKTNGGKYALILIKELSNSSASVDACHILM